MECLTIALVSIPKEYYHTILLLFLIDAALYLVCCFAIGDIADRGP